MVGLVRRASASCLSLGSPLYAALLDHVADDVLAGGPAASVLAGHEDDPGDSALALRLAGTVHGLALTGRAPDLARHYPSTGGDGDADGAWPAFRGVLAEQRDVVRAGLASPPQTNEVGRAAALLGALLHVSDGSLPVRLWEIGASAGLNLRADLFRYVASDGAGWGPPGSPVVLDPAWETAPPGAPRSVDVVERVGGDVAPVDVGTEDGALRLASYVWPDQLDRLARLRGAVDVARRQPVRLVQSSALELVERLSLADGALTVLWHSIMWQYLDAREQEAVLARLDAVGAEATERTPLLHIAFEPLGPEGTAEAGVFAVAVTSWPGGVERVLGQAPPHGVPVTWTR